MSSITFKEFIGIKMSNKNMDERLIFIPIYDTRIPRKNKKELSNSVHLRIRLIFDLYYLYIIEKKLENNIQSSYPSPSPNLGPNQICNS